MAETEIGGQDESFPSTMWTLVREASAARDPLSRLLSMYWRPIYAYIRRKWRKSIEDTKDLTQDFLQAILEGDLLAGVDRGRGSFRAYLKASLDHFVIDRHRRDIALKRGGAGFDFDLSESTDLVANDGEEPSDAFDREWIASLLAEGVRQLEAEMRREGKPQIFGAFQMHYLEETERTYDEIALALGIKATDVGNRLREARQRLREILRARVRETVASPEDEDRELDFLLCP